MFIVVNPFARMGFSLKQAIGCIFSGWLFAIALPVLSSVLSSQPITNSACIPIGGESVSVVFSSIYVAVNSIIFLCSACAYSAIIVKLATRFDSPGTNSPKSRSAVVRLCLLILSNFTISITICILSLLQLTRVYIPAIGVALLTLLLFPLNACLNPIINTWTMWTLILRNSTIVKHNSTRRTWKSKLNITDIGLIKDQFVKNKKKRYLTNLKIVSNLAHVHLETKLPGSPNLT